jgi:hypothetical protein
VVLLLAVVHGAQAVASALRTRGSVELARIVEQAASVGQRPIYAQTAGQPSAWTTFTVSPCST